MRPGIKILFIMLIFLAVVGCQANNNEIPTVEEIYQDRIDKLKEQRDKYQEESIICEQVSIEKSEVENYVSGNCFLINKSSGEANPKDYDVKPISIWDLETNQIERKVFENWGYYIACPKKESGGGSYEEMYEEE